MISLLLQYLKNYLRYKIQILPVVRYPCKLQLNHVIFVGKACPSMSNFLQNNKAPISLEKVELFYLLHVVTHPWKLQPYHAVLVGYGLVCPKFSKITNLEYVWKRQSDFVDFLHVVIYMLLDIHCQAKAISQSD